MSHIVPDDGITVALHIFLYRRADIRNTVAYFGKLDPFKEALPCNSDQFFCLLADLSAGEGAGTVADKSLVSGANVDGNNIAVVNDPFSGDTVNDFIVYRNTGAGRKSTIAQECGLRTGFHDKFMHKLVYLLCGHTVGHSLAGNAPRSCCDPAGLTHQFNVSAGFDDDAFSHAFKSPEFL